MKAKYVNPFTDFGFKKIFGEEASKPMLIDFLTNLLPESNIVDLTFKDKDQNGNTEDDRKAVYDIYCENSFRTVYYATFPIQDQAEKGNWNYQLKFVYCVGILDFKFDEKVKSGQGEVIHTVQLKDQNNQVFYEKLKFVYLEMPHFVKEIHELETGRHSARLDKWLYFIKHLEDFQNIPEMFNDAIFIQAFEKAEIAKYNADEMYDYQQSLKVFRDNKNTFDYAKETAFDEGKIEERMKIAKALKQNGVPIDIIIKTTGLSESEINEL
jgi:predicted transposase/invertase (TIGR01784 family)